LTAGKDKTIKLWYVNEVAKAELIANYKGHSDDVSGVCLLPNHKIVVSVSEDKTIKLWPMYQ
jgi:WD40 repeat protein